MDALDREVLLALQADGRMSNLALARKLSLSSAMLGRVRRLERSGAIRGYRAVIDPAALGITVRALVVARLREHSEESIREFEKGIQQVPGRPRLLPRHRPVRHGRGARAARPRPPRPAHPRRHRPHPGRHEPRDHAPHGGARPRRRLADRHRRLESRTGSSPPRATPSVLQEAPCPRRKACSTCTR